MTTAHVIPVMSSADVPHELSSGSCWCQPLVDEEPPSGRVVIHRRHLDGPARDPDDDQGWFVTRVGDDELSQPWRLS